MVITLHYFNAGMGGGLKHVDSGTFNYYSMHYLESMSIIAVNCFVLVSGYFMVGKSQVKLIKAINLIGITIFYGLVIYLVISFIENLFNVKGLLTAIIPFYGANWFVASYIVIFLLSPFINNMLNRLSKRQFQQLVFLLIICFSVIPTFFPKVSYNDHGYGVLSFIMFYCFGAFIRLHYVSTKSKWIYLGIYFLATTITFYKFNLNYNYLSTVISSVSLFLFFSKFSFSSKVINYLATFTFAIYIIHTNTPLRYTLFQKILKCYEFWNSPLFLLHLIISVVFIFLLGMAAEIIRRALIGKILGNFKALDRITIGE